MTFLPPIFELDYWGVYDRGVPNKERIIFKPRVRVNLTSFMIVTGIQKPENGVNALQPFYDNAFWFPDVVIDPPTWVFIFTGPGTPTVSTEQYTGAPLHVLYWGRKATIFTTPNIVPVIMRHDGILFPPSIGRQLTEADLTSSQLQNLASSLKP